MWDPRLPHPHPSSPNLPPSHASSSHATAGCPAGEPKMANGCVGATTDDHSKAELWAPLLPNLAGEAAQDLPRDGKPGGGELPPATPPERSTAVARSPAGLASSALSSASLPARAPRRRRAPAGYASLPRTWGARRGCGRPLSPLR
jgi:hypothetical protein